MAKDRRDIKERITDLGITNVHVAKQLNKHVTTISRIISGENNNKETIDRIHNYLDKVKTRYGKDFPKETK
jgi:plasmid maintenance system antidote protein VapI